MQIEPTQTNAIRAWFQENPGRMTIKAARLFSVPEASVLHALKGQWPITELRPDAFAEIMEGLRKVGLVRVLVRNELAVLEADVNLENAKFSTTGTFFNIDAGNFDFHIKHQELTTAFAIEKRSHMNVENITYSFQFFRADGTLVMKVFLWQDFPRIPTAAIEAWQQIIARTALNRDATVTALSSQ